MNCQEVRDRLPLQLYGDLTADDRDGVEAHLAQCPACRAELDALRAVRQGLDAAPVTTSGVDLLKVFRIEADTLRRRSRRLRLMATMSGVVAICALLVLGLRLELRVGAGQLTVRWGEPQVAPAPAERTVVIKPEPVTAPDVEERLQTMSAIIQALAANSEATDRQRQEQLDKLRQELAALRTQSQRRLSQTEREVSALYTAQFGSRPIGVNP